MTNLQAQVVLVGIDGRLNSTERILLHDDAWDYAHMMRDRGIDMYAEPYTDPRVWAQNRGYRYDDDDASRAAYCARPLEREERLALVAWRAKNPASWEV